MVKKIAMWIAIAFVAFMAWGFYLTSTPEGQVKGRDRDAIELCWSNQSKKSNSAGDSQFIAGACEMMEARFKKTWNVNP